MSKGKKALKGVLIFGILATIIFLFGMFIVYPSILSCTLTCKKDSMDEKDLPEDWELSGVTKKVGGEVSIDIMGNSSAILKHEIVHVCQMERGFPSLSCSKPLQKYLSEMEAYIMSKLPDPIFYGIYHPKNYTIKDNGSTTPS